MAVPLFLLLAFGAGAVSSTPAGPYDEGVALYRQGRFAEALEKFEQARRSGDTAEIRTRVGWTLFQLDRPEEAQASFQAALEKEAAFPEALAGLGYCALRAGRLRDAVAWLEQAAGADPASADVQVGLGLAFSRLGQVEEARRALARALELDPARQAARDELSRLPAPVPPRKPLVRPETLQLGFRTGRDYFEVLRDGRWEPIFVQGMNLGAALPGRFPSQFPQDKETYARWLQEMAAMGCNVVRVYTIHPPVFYQALAEHNRQARDPLYVIHGVWTELPEDDDFSGAEFQGQFEAEMRRVIDLLHGQADLPPRPGHSSGSYTVDVSPWVLAYLLGREWEPFSVVAYDGMYPGKTFEGRYLRMTRGNPMEAWLAEMCDYAVSYEMDRYHAQRPISFTNWPTLDPLTHPTESTVAEEDALLAERGERLPRATREYDNDALGVTVRHFETTPAFQAGLYASYHAYPYYPDFMVLDPGYRQARDSKGPSAYIGYLRELKAFYGSMPLLIAEYGVPSSRGNAHLQPQGWHHGGHNEQEQAEIDARLTLDLLEARCAGGVLFAWIDEWFKKNWAVIDVEVPLDRNLHWLNPLDAEQNYGMRAMLPGAEGLRVTLSGKASEWSSSALLASREDGPDRSFPDGADPQRTLKALFVDSDEAWLYLRLDVGAPPDFSKARYAIAMDTYDRTAGDHRLPLGLDAETRNGVEFVLLLAGEDSRLLAAEAYRPWIPRPIEGGRGEVVYFRNPHLASLNVTRGVFEPIVLESNRRRLGRDGTVYPAQRLEWGRLRSGSLDPQAPDYDTLADWRVTGSMIEVRLPWSLINVSDPSSLQVLHDRGPSSDKQSRTTDGFTFLALSFKPGPEGAAVPTGRRGNWTDLLPGPQGGEGPLAATKPWLWKAWEEPTWHTYLKPAYHRMQALFREVGGRPPAREAGP